MKKVMDKLFNNIRFDKKYVFFCFIIVLIGIICGSFFIVILNNSDKSLIIEYIQDFMSYLINDNLNYLDILKNTIIINLSIVLVISIIGFTYFFFPINILILFYKSFVIGFSLASFVLTYNIKGIIYSFIYIFPHLIINICLFCLLTSFTLKLSINMINYILRRKEVNMGHYSSKYICVILLFLFLISITSLYESFAAPFLLKLIVKLI